MNKKLILAGIAAAVCAVMGFFSLIIVVAGGQNYQQRQEHVNQAGLQCQTSWQEGTTTAQGLTSQQFEVAKIIYEVAIETGAGPQGAIVGIATAKQESDLGADASTLRPNEDHDVGIFQQRSLVGWYANGATQEENVQLLLDHRTAARTFFLGNTTKKGEKIPGLLDIAGWQSMSVTDAAQAVQRSAHPDAYAKHESMARAVVMLLQNSAGPVVCNGVVGGDGISGDLNCPPTGMGGEYKLNADALRALRCVKKYWPQIVTIGGIRNDPGSDHHTGDAIDVMIPNYASPAGIELGTQIAHWAQKNAQGLGVKYVIWREQIWSAQRASEGWRNCGTPQASCYKGSNDTAAHRDHPHISFYGAAGTGVPANGADGNNGDSTSQSSAPSGDGKPTRPLDMGTYRLSSRYGNRLHPVLKVWKMHTGLDFAAPGGTPIKAVMGGEVVGASYDKAYGNLVRIRSAAGEEFYYAHLSKMNVRVGQKVQAGHVVGQVGTTGYSTGNHLHLEVRINGLHTDPEAWFKRKGIRI